MDKIWLKHYPDGVPHTISCEQYASLADLLVASCQTFSERTAFENFGQSLSYDDLNKLSRDFAAFLQHKLGAKKGQRMVLMLPNSLQYPVAMLAALRAGLIIVNSNPLYTEYELKELISDTKPDILITWKPASAIINKIIGKTPLKHIIITELGDLFGVSKRVIFNTLLRFKYPTRKIPGAICFRHALQQGAKLNFSPPSIERTDTAFLQYTGGTSGDFKAAILSHHNLMANLAQIHAWLQTLFSDTASNSVLTALPLYHIFSLTANALSFMKIGACNVLVTDPRDINALIKLLKRKPINAITGVNPLFHALLRHHDFKNINFMHLKLTLGGGAPLRVSLAKTWQTITQKPLLEAYGLTEASPAIAISPFYLREHNGSVGLPLPSTDVSIRDAEGQELPCGQAGEIWVRGPQVMQGYWQKPEATKDALSSDGWLKTGDMAQMDEKGFITLLERKKDVIIVSGFNVYPSDIENILMKHPKIIDAAVIGIPHHIKDEQIKAFVVTNDSDLKLHMIQTHCRKYLTGYKIPSDIQFIDQLPKSPVGKVLKHVLKSL